MAILQRDNKAFRMQIKIIKEERKNTKGRNIKCL